MRSRPRWNTSAVLPSSVRSSSSIAAEGRPSIQTTPSPTESTRPRSATRSAKR